VEKENLYWRENLNIRKMKKLAFKLGLIFIIIIGYVFMINAFANIISITFEQEKITTETIIGGTAIKIGMGDSVSVQVIRKKHFYGRFYVNDGKEILDFFYLVRIPWRIKNHNFWIFHLIFLITIVLFSILIFTKQKVYKDENIKLNNWENYDERNL